MKSLHELCSPHQQCIRCHMYNYALFHMNFDLQHILWQEQSKLHANPVRCHRSPECEHTGLYRHLHAKVQETMAPEGTHFMAWAIWLGPEGTRGWSLYAKNKTTATCDVLEAIVLHSNEGVHIITSTGEATIRSHWVQENRIPKAPICCQTCWRTPYIGHLDPDGTCSTVH